MAETKKTEGTTEAKAESFKVTNNGPALRYVEGVRLLPGVETEVTAEQLDKMKAGNAAKLFQTKTLTHS